MCIPTPVPDSSWHYDSNIKKPFWEMSSKDQGYCMYEVFDISNHESIIILCGIFCISVLCVFLTVPLLLLSFGMGQSTLECWGRCLDFLHSLPL